MLHEPRRRRSWLIFDVGQKNIMNRFLLGFFSAFVLLTTTGLVMTRPKHEEKFKEDTRYFSTLPNGYLFEACLKNGDLEVTLVRSGAHIFQMTVQNETIASGHLLNFPTASDEHWNGISVRTENGVLKHHSLTSRADGKTRLIVDTDGDFFPDKRTTSEGPPARGTTEQINYSFTVSKTWDEK